MGNFQVDIVSPDLMRQMELLKFYPEIYKSVMYPAMQGATRDLKTEISVPVLSTYSTHAISGLAVSTFRAKATLNKDVIEGRVGWWGSNKAFYIRFVEYGTSNISPRKFMESGFESGKDAAYEKIQNAATEIVNRLAVP